MSNNKFIDVLCEIVRLSRYKTIESDEYSVHNYKVEEKTKGFWIFKKKTREAKKIPSCEVLQNMLYNTAYSYDVFNAKEYYTFADQYEDYVAGYVRKLVTFKILWDFCDFIKMAEYLILYPNSAENNLYVEASDYRFGQSKEDKTRSIIIKSEGYYTLRIDMEEVIEERFSGNAMKVIKLTLDKHFTDQKPQTIICIDEISDDNLSIHDDLFLKNINDLICDQCRNTYKNIVNSIIKEHGVEFE